MSNGFGMIIEGLVAILLMLTIGYCMLLNRRLKLSQGRRAVAARDHFRARHRHRNRRARHCRPQVTVHECDVGLGRAAQPRRGHEHRARSQARPPARTCSSPVPDRRPPAGRRRSRPRRSRTRKAIAARRASLRRAIAHQGARPRGMMRYIRDLRLIPIAAHCLRLPVGVEGGRSAARRRLAHCRRRRAEDRSTAVVRTTADVPRPSSSMLSWASQMFNFPDGSGATAGAGGGIAAGR